MDKALLALADGTVFEGTALGYRGETSGEVVFNTAMTGYQEIFTDPSYFEVVQNSEFTLTGALEFADQEEVQVAAYYILFIPPDPTVLIAYKDGSLITTSEGKVIMRVKGQEQRAEITVNAAGQVTF